MKAKEMWKSTRNAVVKVARMKFKKYVLVLALGVFIVGFLGENSVVAHLRNKARIAELEADVARNLAVTASNQEQIRMLTTDPKAVERVGRERYFMQRPDEDVFVLSDDAPQDITAGADATVE